MKKGLTILTLFILTIFGAGAQQTSVLAAGDWWRLEVRTTGIYRLTVADVPQLQGASFATIGLYGSSGTMLPTDNSQLPLADLQPVPADFVDHNGNGLMDNSDELLFFGEGSGVWRYRQPDRRWEYTQHPYAAANYYYLTNTAPTPSQVPMATVPAADTTMSDYTHVTHWENDITNMYESGQIWMGEKFSTTVPSRSITLNLPSSSYGLRLRYALASIASVTCSFRVKCGQFDQTHYIQASSPYITKLEAISQGSTSLTFDITYRPGEGTANGYLDYIEVNSTSPLTFGGGQKVIRNERGIGRTVRYTASGMSGARVWDVSRVGSVHELAVSDGSWTDTVVTPKTYILFNGSSYLSPSSVVQIDNQNLHGMEAVDYIVVCHPALLPQAQRLASLHSIIDGMEAVALTDQQVYDEFSSGKQDPMAIRAMLRHLYTTHADHAPRYLVLMGKPTYDPRDLMGYAAGTNITTLVTYQTAASFDDEGYSLCSDDIIGYLDEWENGSSSQSLDISIGRLPAKSLAEATLMVDKIEAYMMRRDLDDSASANQGDWRNYVALLADDADPSHPGDTIFAHSSEYAASQIKQNYPNINIDRFYADAYHQQSGAIGSFYPDLNNALRQRMNYGCLLLNYIGHGSARYIGTERYIEPSDISTYTNRNRLPLVVTSTCSYGRHDSPSELSGAELFLLSPNGAIGVVSATRKVSHVQRFNTDVIINSLDTTNGIGDALRIAKNRTSVSMSFGLTGDPALRLSIPRNEVVVTEINHRPVSGGTDDTATVLSQVTVSGEVHGPDGQLISDFDGQIYPIVFDREMRSHTLANDNPGTEVNFIQQKSMLYKGTADVTGGRFEYTFTVPRDVSYQYAYGKLSHYARSGNEDAAGSYNKILFGGFDENAVIGDARPNIRLFMGDTNFRDGGLTDTEPTLIALLSDSVGINAVGSGLGHDITAVIDNNPGSLIVLGDMYEPNIGDSRSGTVRYTLNSLTPGMHTLTLKAWNIWGNSASADISFRVASSDTLEVSSLSVSPNPATTQATFHYETNSTAHIESAELQIYSASGARIMTFTPTVAEGSFVVGPVTWNLAGVHPGIYLARMLITTSDGDIRQSTTKLIVR